MPTGCAWAMPDPSGSCAGGEETPLAATKITYRPCTCPAIAAAGKEIAHGPPLPQVQGLEAPNGGKFVPTNTVALGNNPLLAGSWAPRSIARSQFSDPFAPLGSLTLPSAEVERNSPPKMLLGEGRTGTVPPWPLFAASEACKTEQASEVAV